MGTTTDLFQHLDFSPFDFLELYLVELGFLCQVMLSSFRFFANSVFNA